MIIFVIFYCLNPGSQKAVRKVQKEDTRGSLDLEKSLDFLYGNQEIEFVLRKTY